LQLDFHDIGLMKGSNSWTELQGHTRLWKYVVR